MIIGIDPLLGPRLPVMGSRDWLDTNDHWFPTTPGTPNLGDPEPDLPQTRLRGTLTSSATRRDFGEGAGSDLPETRLRGAHK